VSRDAGVVRRAGGGGLLLAPSPSASLSASSSRTDSPWSTLSKPSPCTKSTGAAFSGTNRTVPTPPAETLLPLPAYAHSNAPPPGEEARNVLPKRVWAKVALRGADANSGSSGALVAGEGCAGTASDACAATIGT
jgi:hypothetical protein